jgi:hypothetical protein
MKAMLDPMMVAASIHVWVLAAHEASTSRERMTASSQGGLMGAMDAA